jgi:hypothetical protein
MSRTLFVTNQDMPDLWILRKSIVQRQYSSTGKTKHDFNTFPD